MPTIPAIITINDLQQYIHNWLYNIGEPVNITELLLKYYPDFADYVNPIYDNSEAEKLQFLFDLRQYIEDEILYFDRINIKPPRTEIGLLEQVNAEISYSLTDMHQKQEQHVQLQYIIAAYVNNNNRGQEISQARIKNLQLNIVSLIAETTIHDNHSRRKLLLLCGELVLARILLKVYSQELAIDSVALNVADLQFFLNNISFKPINDPSVFTQDLEKFVRNCWHLWQLDILEACIKADLRLPGNMYLINELQGVIASDDQYSASIIQRLTSQLQIEEVTEITEPYKPKVLILMDDITTPENSETPGPAATSDDSVTADTNTDTDAIENIATPEVSETPTIIEPIIESFLKLKQAIAELNSAEFNRLIQDDDTLLTSAVAMLEPVISSNPNTKRIKKIIKFVTAIQIPLKTCNELIFQANEVVFSVIQSKIEALETELQEKLQRQFQNYLDSDATVLPVEFNNLMTKQLHAAINNLDLDKVKFLMSKGADEFAKNEAEEDALAILLKKISTTKVDNNIIAIGHAIDADIVHTTSLPGAQGKKAEKVGKEGLLFKYYTHNNKNALTHEEFLDIFAATTNEAEIRFQSLLPHANFNDSQGRPLLTICLQKNFTATALKIIEACTFTSTIRDKQGNTFLHSWAQYTPNNIELLKALLSKYIAPKDHTHEDLNTEYGDSFLHSLLRNMKVDENIALRALSVIFKTTDIYFLRAILATKNKNGNTAIVLSEIRDWKKVTKYLGQQLAALIENLALNQVNIKGYFKHALDYFNQKSQNVLIHRKLQAKAYGEIQQLVEARDQIRSNIKNIAKQIEFDDNGAFYAIVRQIFGSFDYCEIYVNGIFLIDHIKNLSHNDPDPAIASITLSPMIPRLLTETPLTDSLLWEQIMVNCKINGFTHESKELLNKLKEHSIDFKVDPNITDEENANMLDYAAGLGDLDLVKAVISEFNLILKPKSLLHACASNQELDTPEHATLAYLCDLYENSRVADDPKLPAISEIRDGSTLDMLCKAAFTCRNISKFKWLLQHGYSSDKLYIYGNNLLKLIIINTGATENTAKLDCSYALTLIKELLAHDAAKFRQMVIHRDDFGGTALDQTIAIEHKSSADIQPFYEILDLLISNGASLTNITNCGQNILHYVAQFGDQTLATYIKEKIIKTHSHLQLNCMHLQIDNEGMTPMMLVDIKDSNKANLKTHGKQKKLVISS